MLWGRDPERATIGALLAAAQESRGGALVLHGPPGVGKTALLDDAVARAEGMRVLSTQGVETEAPLPFAALQRLLQPAVRAIDALPDVQARALRVALGAAAGPPAERFAVSLAVLGLLSAAADEAPVLCVVDDAHWLDDATASALQFAARRLAHERVALLLGARDGDVRELDRTGLPSLPLAGLDERAARALLSHHVSGEVPSTVSAELVRRARGNPLALSELPAVLTEAQLSGGERLPEELPVTEGVQRAFLDRWARLGAHARHLLVVAAIDGSARRGVVLAATAALGHDTGPAVLAEVESSGLLTVDGGRLEFRHPLVRAALSQAAPGSTRLEVHQALADVLPDEVDAEQRAWHLAAVATGPDETVAVALDDAADRALRRGGHEAASAASARAAALTPDDEPRAARLLSAATSAWLGGDPARAGSLATEGGPLTTDPAMRADLARLRGRAEFHAGSVATAVRVWTQAARDVAHDDPARALETGVLALAASTFVTPAERTDLDPADLGAAPGPGATPRRRCLHGLALGLHDVLRDRLADAAAPLRAAFAAAPDVTDPDLANAIGIAAFHLAEDAAYRHTFARLLPHARQHGALGLLLFTLPRLALADLCEGRIGDAVAHAEEARSLALDAGRPGLAAMPLAELTLFAALRGEERYDALLTDLDDLLGEHRVGVLGALVDDTRRWAVGEHCLAAGAYAEGLHHLEQVRTPPLRRLAGHTRVEAAVRAGRLDLATAWRDEIGAFADAVGSPHALALAALVDGLLAEGTGADEHFGTALEHHVAGERPLEAARVRLARGEALRRARQRVAAREHLREALRAFEDAGTGPWAERARQELRASGETARRRATGTAAGGSAASLTAQERQVARFVAGGLSNRDVAAQLFLSPRTIDFHLRNVFAKTGITSRAELARLDLG